MENKYLKLNYISMVNDSLVFLQDKKTKLAFEEIMSYISLDSEVYLVSGSVRNSLYYNFFHKKLPQRDYDVVIIGNPKTFVNKLIQNGWKRSVNIKKNGIILNKAKKGIKNIKSLSDRIYLDIIFSKKGETIYDNLKKHANFTLNGGAIKLKDIFAKKWMDKITTLPATIEDIKNKQIRLNDPSDTATIFACMRFMSQGFRKPSDKEIGLMLNSLKNINQERFEKNVLKLYNYVGGEKNTRKLLKSLGIKKDIFDYDKIN